jgi:hypothetical protein
MRRIGRVRPPRDGQLATTMAHTGVTHTYNRLNLVLGAGTFNHYHEVHVLLGIEQAAIKILLTTPKFEHANTFGENRQ